MDRSRQENPGVKPWPPARQDRRRWWESSGGLVSVVLLGVLVRVAFLVLSGELELWADETHYVQLGAVWSRFGFYMGSPSYVWPPLYPAYLALSFDTFGEHGITAAKAGQVLLSTIVGGTVVLLADRLFSRPAAVVAGLLWAGYLPLVAYTHLLWPETLFLSLLLPAVFVFVTLVEPARPPSLATLRLVLVGVLLGLAGLVKEAALPLPVLFGAILLGSDVRLPPARRLARGAILVLAAAVVLLPWTLRCHEVYGRFVVGGSTLGQNASWGVNASYVNFDYRLPALRHIRARESRWHRSLIELPRRFHWSGATSANVIDRSRADVGRAIDFVGRHPGFYLRSRLKRLADWVTPLSFFDRHYRMSRYPGGLNRPPVRRVLVALSVLATMMALAGALPGAFWTLEGSGPRLVIGVVLVNFLATILVVSMSRYRVPAEPLLLVLTAGFATSASPRPPWRSARSAAVVGGWIALGALWALNAGEVWAELSRL